ncbi:MAG: hypothetical protein HXX10_08855 [Rhodoplanes sp.]|uniref:hypothetical protein n=1 Tax=Rhodoplanes sp. TaxID=1968906 RepID=UPI00183F37F3|nr:hypothetical protein [Rhodoplanes sp.]NVO14131.1 hypothetical protein [Rhodoplanes sp.]
MSMEIEILSDFHLKSFDEWQRSIDAIGFPLQLDSNIGVEDIGGFIPARLGETPTGFECYQDNANEVVQSLGLSNLGRAWRFALGLRWKGDLNELQAAWMAAAAYARATNGVIFDYEEGKVYHPPEAIAQVQRIRRDVPHVEAMLREIITRFTPKK